MKHLPENLNWSIIKNAVAQIGGRIFITLSRLLIAIIIVRAGNAHLFGQYALVVGLLFVAEWLVDFGMTDIGVRNICAHPERRHAFLKTLTYLKPPQVLFSFVLLISFVVIMGYDSEIVRAALIGGLGLVFYAGATVYRTVFRVDMCTEKDVAGEFAGVLVMIPLTLYFCWRGAGVDVLVACFVVSRMVFFFVVLAWGKKDFQLSFWPVSRSEATVFYRQALPLGLIGVLVAVSDTTAPVVLSKLLDMDSVAIYSVANRFLSMILIVTQAVSWTFFPILSWFWNKSEDDFRNAQQNCLDLTFLVAGGLFCMINASADFLVSLIGPEMIQAGFILSVMSWAILARAVITAMVPLIIIAGGQQKAMWLVVFSVAANLILVLMLVPHFGILGAALAAVGVQFVFSMIPAIFVSHYLTSIKLDWLPVGKAFLSAALAVAGVSLLGLKGTFWGGLLATILYVLFIFFTGALTFSKLQIISDSVKARARLKETPDPNSAVSPVSNHPE